MEPSKRPWVQLFNAVIFALLFFTRLDTYTDVLPIHDTIYSPEKWQEIQLEYGAILCGYACLVLLSLLRFFLYNRETVLLWTEAVLVTLAAVCLSLWVFLSIETAILTYVVLLALWAIICFDWYSVWKHYHHPQ